MKTRCSALIIAIVSLIMGNRLYSMDAQAARVVEDGELNFSHGGMSDLTGLRDLLRRPEARAMTCLDLSNNGITRLTRGCLMNLPTCCQEVNLAENDVQEVEAGALSSSQCGRTFHIGGNTQLALPVIAAIRAQVEHESFLPRVLMRKSAHGLRFLSSPIGTLLWSVPLTVGLSYKYGHTKWWKAANIGFNAWCAKDAIQRRAWLSAADYLVDSLGQFNVPHHINNIMEQKTGFTLTPIEQNQWYTLFSSLLAIRVFFMSSRDPMYKPLAWAARAASIPAMTSPSYNELWIGNCLSKLCFFCSRIHAQRDLIVKPIFSRIYDCLSGWISRTQNHVSTAPVGHLGECAVCYETKRLSPFGHCGHQFCAFCIEAWRTSVADAGQTCPLCRGPQAARQEGCAEEEQERGGFGIIFDFFARTSW